MIVVCNEKIRMLTIICSAFWPEKYKNVNWYYTKLCSEFRSIVN